jgi:predicted PurR-regulated permease PerM
VLHTVSAIEQNLATWISTMCLINLSLGAFMAFLLFLIGVPNAIMWGAFVFFLNFVPYVGPLIMAIVLLAVGFLTFETTGLALLPVASFMAVVTIEGNFITPQILGHRLNISPFIVFATIVFWSWMWGPTGALLAMPLLIAMQVVLQHLFPSETPDLPG